MDKQNPQQRPPEKRKLFTSDEINWRGIMFVILCILITLIAGVLVTHLSHVAADGANHVSQLFGEATLDPNDKDGFASFVQLIFIAIFCGWTINRFRGK